MSRNQRDMKYLKEIGFFLEKEPWVEQPVNSLEKKFIAIWIKMMLQIWSRFGKTPSNSPVSQIMYRATLLSHRENLLMTHVSLMTVSRHRGVGASCENTAKTQNEFNSK